VQPICFLIFQVNSLMTLAIALVVHLNECNDLTITQDILKYLDSALTAHVEKLKQQAN
jgi:hypothetical protein